MLWTIAAILALLWVLGLVTTTTLGGYLHILVVLAVALLLIGALKSGAKAGRHRGSARSILPSPRGRRP